MAAARAKRKPTVSATRRRTAARKVLRDVPAESVLAAADRLVAHGDGRAAADKLVKHYSEKFYGNLPNNRAAEHIARDMRNLAGMGSSQKQESMAAIVRIRWEAGLLGCLGERSIQAILANPLI